MKEYFLIGCIISSLASFCYGGYVLLNNFKKKLNILCFAMAFSIAIWSLGLALMADTNSFNLAIFYLKYLHYLGAILIAPFFLHFVLVFLDIEGKYHAFIVLNYIIAGVLEIANFIGIFATVTNKYFFTYYTEPFVIYYIFSIMFTLNVIYANYLLAKAYKHSSGNKKLQIKYLLIGLVIGFGGGFTTFPLVFNINLFPFGAPWAFVYVAMATYAIIKHQLLDIKVLIKKSAVILGGAVVLFAGIHLANLFLSDFLEAQFGWWGPKVPIAAAVIIFIYISTYAFRIKEKEVREEVDEQRIRLNNLVSKIEESSRLKEAFLFIPYYITRVTSIKYAAVTFIKEEAHDVFYQVQGISDYTGFQLRKKLKDYVISDNQLIHYLKSNQIIRCQAGKVSIISYLENKFVEEPVKEDTQIKEIMTVLEAKVAIPFISTFQLLGFLILGKKEEEYSNEDITFFKDLAKQAASYLDRLIDREDKINMLKVFAEESLNAIDKKDNYTYWHTKRVAQYSKLIANNRRIFHLLRKIPSGLWGLMLAAELHDIGKRLIPDEILKKKDMLDDQETKIMHTHVEKGLDAIYKYSTYLKKEIIDGILQHHENYDGSGYPKSLKGDEIHLYAHIIHLADAFDAMTTNRPYQVKRPAKLAMEILKENSNKQFHPLVVEAFLEEWGKNSDGIE